MYRSRLFFALAVLLALAGAGWNQTLRAGYLSQSQDPPPVNIDFFDVLDMPARIDNPSVEVSGKEISLNCAIANRQPEDLLGLRLILMTFDETGRYRSRISWTERDPLKGYSIERNILHPPGFRVRRTSDHFVLGIDEAIGRETIWRASGIEKALRAYARGQHDVIPEVQKITNKFDSRPSGLPVLPLRQRP